MLLPEKDRVLTHEKISVLDQSLSQLEAVELKLAGELDDIRSRIANIRNQRAALKSRIAAVWSLPTELLSYIFELGVMEQEAELEHTAEERSADEDERPHKLGFQVLVSQVCHMFRQVAIRTPSLWTRIHVFSLTPWHLHYVRTCLERSGSSRLDILLECEDEDLMDENDDISPISSFTSLLVPHMYRFQRFTVRMQDFRALYGIIQALDQPAPLLECLELSHVDLDVLFDENEPFDPPELHKPLLLFDGKVPKLCMVALDGVHVAWGTCNFKNLVELQLGYHTRDVRPSYEEFKAIIEASPALRTLGLNGSAPLISENSAESALYMPILMEQLATLTISDIPSEYVSTLICLLQAPNLKSLSLTDLDANDYSALIRSIAGPPVLFPALTALKLATVEVEDAVCGDLLRAYPTLTSLSFYFGSMTLAWLEVLEPQEGEVLCPKLECLRCIGASTYEIKRILESRRDAGFRVPRLELDEESVGWATTACMKWINENAEVDIVVPSVHGSDGDDDDDMDGTGSEWGTDEDSGGFGFPLFSMGGFSDGDGMDEDEDENEGGSGDEDGGEDEGDSDIDVDDDESDGSAE